MSGHLFFKAIKQIIRSSIFEKQLVGQLLFDANQETWPELLSLGHYLIPFNIQKL